MTSKSDDARLDLAQLKQAAGWLTLISEICEERDFRNSPYWKDLVAQSLSKSIDVPPGFELFRARAMPLPREDDVEPLSAGEMGPPPEADALPQRLSRGKVPCFYGALDRDTAVAEIRPWRRARVSVARFVADNPLRLIDLSGWGAGSSLPPQLEWLNFILGRPVHPRDEDSYTPSQMLAEEYQVQGLQGVLYNSALRSGGVNAAIFGYEHLSCRGRSLVEVTGVNYTIAELGSHDA